MIDFISNLFSALGEYIAEGLEKFGETLNDFVSELIKANFAAVEWAFSQVTYLLDNPVVLEVFKVLQAIALSVVAAKLIWELTNTYILRRSGDPRQNLLHSYLRLAVTIVVILSTPMILHTMHQFIIVLTQDINNLTIGASNVTDSVTSTKALVFGAGVFSNQAIEFLISLILSVLLFVFSLIVILQVFVRGIALIFMLWVSPMTSLSLTTNSPKLFSEWLSESFAIMLTQFSQLLFLKLISIAVTANLGGSPILMTVAIMYFVAFKLPNYVKKFTRSTAGTIGSNISSGKNIASKAHQIYKKGGN